MTPTLSALTAFIAWTLVLLIIMDLIRSQLAAKKVVALYRAVRLLVG